MERISNHLNTLALKQDQEYRSLRSDLDQALETLKIHQKNISAIIRNAKDGRVSIPFNETNAVVIKNTLI